MLELKKIKAVYSDVVLALDDVSLTLEQGSVVVLLGSNGSGKSTTLKSISGVLKVEDGELTEGTIELGGRRKQTEENIHPGRVTPRPEQTEIPRHAQDKQGKRTHHTNNELAGMVADVGLPRRFFNVLRIGRIARQDGLETDFAQGVGHTLQRGFRR